MFGGKALNEMLPSLSGRQEAQSCIQAVAVAILTKRQAKHELIRMSQRIESSLNEEGDD